MTGVRATKSSELRRAYADLDTHLALRTFGRIVQNKARGFRVTLTVISPTGRTIRRFHDVRDVPEPWQAPA